MAAPLLPHPAFGADHQCLEHVLRRPERKKIAPQFTGPFASRHNGACWDPASPRGYPRPARAPWRIEPAWRVRGRLRARLRSLLGARLRHQVDKQIIQSIAQPIDGGRYLRQRDPADIFCCDVLLVEVKIAAHSTVSDSTMVAHTKCRCPSPRAAKTSCMAPAAWVCAYPGFFRTCVGSSSIGGSISAQMRCRSGVTRDNPLQHSGQETHWNHQQSGRF